MALTRDEKAKIIDEFALRKGDNGSYEVQIALVTFRINRLIEHFKSHKKDIFSKRGFIKLVQNRRRLLQYLRRESEERYQELIAKLDLRK